MNTNSLTTNSKWLDEATKQLRASKIESARLDALLILETVTKQPRIKIISNPDKTLGNKDLDKLNSLLKRRLSDEPMAYIRGFSEFYGREFIVSSSVLVPRPESESFIELLKEMNIGSINILDLGCGSGCLGITIKLEFPKCEVDLSDKSKEAIEIARLNIAKFNLNLRVIISSLLSSLSTKYDVIVANLPYVPNTMSSLKNLSHEPQLALFSGTDGLQLYKEFWQQVGELVDKPNYILCESLETQHQQMRTLAKDNGYLNFKTEGLVQLFNLS